MPRTHIVRQGECLSRIAKEHGFSNYREIYDSSENEALRRKRPNPNLLYPGDEVFIPDRDARVEFCATDRHHLFRAKPPTRWVRIAVEDEDNRRLSNAAYTLEFDAAPLNGTTDGDGVLEHEVPFDAEGGVLTVGALSWKVYVAHLNPVEDDSPDQGISGLQARLRNLGYPAGPIDGIFGPKTRLALRFFQADQSLESTGTPDASTRAKIVQVHGC